MTFALLMIPFLLAFGWVQMWRTDNVWWIPIFVGAGFAFSFFGMYVSNLRNGRRALAARRLRSGRDLGDAKPGMMLDGKQVKAVRRGPPNRVVVEFVDGSTVFGEPGKITYPPTDG